MASAIFLGLSPAGFMGITFLSFTEREKNRETERDRKKRRNSQGVG
jgi:hypothetical protein